MPGRVASRSWEIGARSAPRPRPVPVARRVPVAAEEPLIGSARYDYADAFEIHASEPDARTAEQFARCALEQAASPIRITVAIVQRKLLRLQLAPRESPEHLAGWAIRAAESDVIKLEAVSPLARGVIVGRRVDPTRTVITTYLFFRRPRLARLLWTIVAPLHRRVAVHLMERAAASGRRADSATEAFSA
jgi:hypothetical protein